MLNYCLFIFCLFVFVCVDTSRLVRSVTVDIVSGLAIYVNLSYVITVNICSTQTFSLSGLLDVTPLIVSTSATPLGFEARVLFG